MVSGRPSRASEPELPAAPPWQREVVTVGVTGTNGKTTTTTWIARLMEALGGPVARLTTLGFFLAGERQELPEDWQGFVEGFARLRAAGGRHAAVEYTSHTLARGMAQLWPPRVAVFTNFTRDHLDHHGSPEHYLASKAQLFRALGPGGVAVLNAGDPASELLREVIPDSVRVLSYFVPSRGEACLTPDLTAQEVTLSWGGTRIVSAGLEHLTLELSAVGDVHAENALAAALAARALGVDARAIVSLLAGAPAPPGRFEIIGRDPAVVVDYAHTPDALTRTLATARRLCSGALVVVFGAGGDRDHEKRPLLGDAARLADRILLTSDNPRSEDPREIALAIQAGIGAHPAVEIELDREQAITRAILDAGPADVVVIAGKGHEATQAIHGQVLAFSDGDVSRAALARR